MSASRGRLRRVAGWLPALVLVPVAVVGVVRFAEVPDAQARFGAVQPLDLGTTWVYAVSDHGEPSGTRTSQVVERERLLTLDGPLDASRVSRHYTDYPGTGERTLLTYLAADGDRLVQPAQLDGVTFSRLEPPAPAYEVPARAGTQVSYDGTYAGNPFAYEGEVAEVGEVEVGGTTFTGCARWVNTIELADEDFPDAVEVLEEWTCPGYGPVRSVDTVEAYGTEITEELVEFHGAAGDWYAAGEAPDPGGPPTSPAGGTEGIDAARSFAVPDGELGSGLAWTEGHPGAPAGPPVSDGETVVVTDLAGQVSARSTTTGEVRWRLQVDAPVIVTPLVLDGPDDGPDGPDDESTVLVADGARQLWALSMADGHARWVRELDDVLASAPTVTAGGVAVATEAGTLAVLAAGDGTTVWETTLGGPARTAPAAADGSLLVADSSGTLTAFDADDGDARWTRALAEGVAAGPAIAGDRVVVGDRNGSLHAFALDDGEGLWVRSVRQVTEALSVGEDVVVAMSSADRVAAYDLEDGERRWARGVPDVDSAPVVVGDEAVLLAEDGLLLRLGLTDGEIRERRALPRPAEDVGANSVTDTEVGLVGSALVFTVRWDSTLSDTVLYAVPVDGSSADGAVLHLDGYALPGPPNEPPVADGEALLAGIGADLVRLEPDGSSAVLASAAQGLQSAAVVRDGTAYVRVDDELRALDAATGEVAWAAPAGPAYLGARAAVGDDAVAVGVEGSGVVSLDRASGEVRWVGAVPEEFSVATPLLLPDGDVVYGGGPLTRFDGATGDPLWQVPDTYLFGPAAYGGGLVVAQAQGFESAPRLAAYDARTGAQRWSVEQDGVPSLLGPTLSDGVVVSADAQGLVTGRSATDGTELWRLDLHRPLAGRIAAADGRVLLAAAGTAQSATDRDYRVLALDLRTGRFLGGWEPGFMPFQVAPNPVVGATDGRLLVATAADLVAVEARS